MEQKKRLFFHGALIVFAVFFLHLIASDLYWYYSIWWFDMPMHFLGGMFIGMMALWLFCMPNSIKSGSPQTVFKVFLVTLTLGLVVGFFWEFFEYGVGHLFSVDLGNTLDSTSDLFFDIAGSQAAALYFFLFRFDKQENRI